MIKPNMKLSNNTTVSYYSLVVAIAKPVDLAVNEYIEGAFRIVEPKECSGKQDLEYMEANEAMEDDMSVNAEAFPSGHVTL